jgi:hypothetical protein
VVHTTVLGYLLGAARCSYLDEFLLLRRQMVSTVETWAAMATKTRRQMENICSIHVGLPPSDVIALYYALCWCLHDAINGPGPAPSGRQCEPDREAVSRHFCRCVDRVSRRMDDVFGPFLRSRH